MGRSGLAHGNASCTSFWKCTMFGGQGLKDKGDVFNLHSCLSERVAKLSSKLGICFLVLYKYLHVLFPSSPS